MQLPYYVLQLKADLSLDDCVDFLNSVTDNGKKSFRNLFVALPFSRLQEMANQFKDSGISFGASCLNSADEGAFTQLIAAKMVKDASGIFALIGTPEERKIFAPSLDQLARKLKAAHQAELKVLFCVQDDSEDEIQKELEVLKNSQALENDTHPIILFLPDFKQFREYLPQIDELQALFDKFHRVIGKTFPAPESLSLLVALPSDLAQFSSLLDKIPFQGAFFIKSGIYPHAVHQETLQLMHIHAEELEF